MAPRTHFAQIDANRVVGVNRLPSGACEAGNLFAIMSFFGVKKIRFLIEGKPQRLVTLARKLIL